MWAAEPVLWRPIVALANSSKEVRIALRPNEPDLEPARLTIDPERATLEVAGERTVVEHGGDSGRMFEGSGQLRATRDNQGNNDPHGGVQPV